MQTATATTQVPADPHVFLIGRPPLGEYLGFLKTQTVEGQAADPGGLAKQWRSAREHLKQLASTESGVADDPPTSPLPASLTKPAERVLEDPVTRQSFGMLENEIKMVELDRLVVFQKQINVSYAAQLQAAPGEGPSDEELLGFALPIDGRYDPTPNIAPLHFGPIGAQVWGAVSPSMDYRVLTTALLDPSQVSGMDVNGRASHIIAVAVGYGSNYLSAMRVGRRLILRNGSHRAYALRAAGHTHAPVLIQHIPQGEEAEHLPPDVQQQREAYLEEPRPPLLRDYFNENLHLVVHVPKKTRQLRVAVNYEEGGAPGV